MGDGEEGVIQRAMGWKRKATTNYCRLQGGKGIGRWWESKIGRFSQRSIRSYVPVALGPEQRIQQRIETTYQRTPPILFDNLIQ